MFGELECADDLACEAGLCIARLADGAACAEQPAACASGFCLDGTCGQPTAGHDVGEPCSPDACRTDLICDDVCQAFHVVEEGGPCSVSALGGEGCVVGLICQVACEQGICENDGVCGVPPGVGETCSFLGQCDVGSTCVGFGFDEQQQQIGVCQARGAAGDPCPCDPWLACVNGECTPYGAALCG